MICKELVDLSIDSHYRSCPIGRFLLAGFSVHSPRYRAIVAFRVKASTPLIRPPSQLINSCVDTNNDSVLGFSFGLADMFIPITLARHLASTQYILIAVQSENHERLLRLLLFSAPSCKNRSVNLQVSSILCLTTSPRCQMIIFPANRSYV